MYNGTIIKKIPGKLPTDKSLKDGHIDDLSKLTKPQLLDLLERQKRLLANKGFINKLADKGEKVVKLKNEIEKELKKRDESEKLSALMERLSVNGKDGLDALEWTGNCAPGYTTVRDESKEINVESDDDDDLDPLKILVSHSGAGFHKKQHRVLKPEEPLIRPSDIIDSDTQCKNDSSSNVKDIVEDEYARVLCKRLDSTSKTKERFLPHRTLKSTLKEEKEKKQSKFWEVTAATPPSPVHGDTKMVSLEESIRLQYEQQQKLTEVQMKHATERLAATKHLKIGNRVPQATTGYRERAASSSSDDEVSEHEQEHDDDDDDRGGDNIVVYNLVD